MSAHLNYPKYLYSPLASVRTSTEQPGGAVCRESGKYGFAWEAREVIPWSTPNFLLGSTDDPEKEEMKQPSRSTPRTISQAQVNKLYTLATEEVGLSKERAKEVLQSCGYNSAKNIIAEDYNRVFRVFQDLARSGNFNSTHSLVVQL